MSLVWSFSMIRLDILIIILSPIHNNIGENHTVKWMKRSKGEGFHLVLGRSTLRVVTSLVFGGEGKWMSWVEVVVDAPWVDFHTVPQCLSWSYWVFMSGRKCFSSDVYENNINIFIYSGIFILAFYWRGITVRKLRFRTNVGI